MIDKKRDWNKTLNISFAIFLACLNFGWLLMGYILAEMNIITPDQYVIGIVSVLFLSVFLSIPFGVIVNKDGQFPLP